MKERFAALLMLLATLGIPGLVYWYQGHFLARQTPADSRVITLTARGGGTGVYTQETISSLNYWWKEFTPATLYLERGEKILLILQSTDVTHRFYVPELGLGPLEIRPGHPRRLEFVANRAGLFKYFCTTVCGPCHFYMSGWIVVTPAGIAPVRPQPVVCPDCFFSLARPPSTNLPVLGEYLFLTSGCVACHGLNGIGGIPNPNYAKETIPAHNRTVDKLFLRSPEAAESFLGFLASARTDEWRDEIPLANVVIDRYQALATIIRNGSQPQRHDPSGPEPPLWMPAWRYRLTDDEIDALVAYFVSLADWEDDLLEPSP